MDSLTDAELHALRNLAQKRTGAVTAFLNIADARRLTELGLATRSRQGWDITAAGAAHLAMLDGGEESGSIIDLRPPPAEPPDED